MSNSALELKHEGPGTIGAVSAYAGSLDLPNTSVTMHSHLKQRPMSSSRTLYEQECCAGKGSKDFVSPSSDEQNLQDPCIT